MKKNTLKIGLWAVIILLGLWACQKDLETPQPINEDKEMAITDSIHKISTEKLPDFFKAAIEDSIFIKPSITARNGNGSQYLEEQAYSVLSEEGITSYSVPIRKGTAIEKVIKDSSIAQLISDYKTSCDKKQQAEGADEVFSSYEVISMNSKGDMIGDPVYIEFVNYGSVIKTTDVNLNTGLINETWTPNPISNNFHGNEFWEQTGEFFGVVLNGIWTGITWFVNTVWSVFTKKECNCSQRPSISGRSASLSKNQCCDDNNSSSLSVGYNVVLPIDFLKTSETSKTSRISSTKDIDCDCLFGNSSETSETKVSDEELTLQDQAYFDCSCKSDNINGIAQYLQLTAKEKGYLERDKALKGEICKFIWDNNYSEEAIAFAKEAIKAKMAGGEVDFPNKVILDKEFVNNRCLNSVYEDMGKATKFKEYLQKFESDFSVAHLRFSSSTKLPSKTNAETSAPNDYTITITFNENNLNRPRLSIARTFIHEIIHAEIFRKLLSVAQHPSIQLNQTQIMQLKNDYPGLYDYYVRWKWNVPKDQKPSSPQHEAMAQHYREVIKQALKEFDNTQTEETYNALSWVGLMGTGTLNTATGLYSNSTQAWVNTPLTERLKIINTIKNFRSINPNNCQ